MIVRVPASSANLGPGFDTLGMALSMHAEAGVITGDVPAGAQRSTSSIRPASHSGVPVARVICGCVRRFLSVGGWASAARCASPASLPPMPSAIGSDPELLTEYAPEMLALASELEGHADNVAASLLGGIVATADGRAVRVPMAFDPAVVVWIPSFTTSTDESRTKLGSEIPLSDAVFNIGRVALLVAALAAGDTDALRSATQDRLHQDRRLASAEPSKIALQAALDAGGGARGCRARGPPWRRCAPSTMPTISPRRCPPTATRRCCASTTVAP